MNDHIQEKYAYARYIATEELKRIKNKEPQEVQTVRVSRIKKLCDTYKELLEEYILLNKK